MNAEFELYIVSNQPNYAKGKSTLAELAQIHERIESELSAAGIKIRSYHYCYHHPQGVVAEYSGECDCRKPKPGLVLKAIKADKLNPGSPG